MALLSLFTFKANGCLISLKTAVKHKAFQELLFQAA